MRTVVAANLQLAKLARTPTVVLLRLHQSNVQIQAVLDLQLQVNFVHLTAVATRRTVVVTMVGLARE